MDIKPKIDIIVPCYNVERAINRTLKSLIAQNYPKDQYHCYFVNDASTDTTTSILNSYLDHSEITIINHEGNKGRAVTRNVGIKQSSSEFICFLLQFDSVSGLIFVYSQCVPLTSSYYQEIIRSECQTNSLASI